MLVLMRRPGESVTLITPFERIVVKVSSVKGCQVRLAFDCADDVIILRSELAPLGSLKNPVIGRHPL